jgi:Glycosyl hydrolases family 16
MQEKPVYIVREVCPEAQIQKTRNSAIKYVLFACLAAVVVVAVLFIPTSSGYSSKNSSSKAPETFITTKWNTCTADSTCEAGFTCCTAYADLASGKRTCRQQGLAVNAPNGCGVATLASVSAKVVPEWETCFDGSTCANGFTCCTAPTDVASGKRTCRQPGLPINAPNGCGVAISSSVRVVPQWETCFDGSICANGFTCCTAPSDVGSGKRTCRQPGLAVNAPNGCGVASSGTTSTQPTVGRPNQVGNCKSGVFPNIPSRMRNGGWSKSGGIDSSVDVNQHDWILEYGAANLRTSAGQGFETSLINQPGQAASGITITSTRYMFYGRVSVNLKAINVPGAITTFITMSDVGDEIDYEITGNPVQPNTNVFDQSNSKTGPAIEHFQHFTTLSGFDMNIPHKYTIDWKHNSIEWLVDDRSVRFLRKSESVSALTGQEWFPNTPSLIQFGVWDASYSSDPRTTQWVKY